MTTEPQTSEPGQGGPDDLEKETRTWAMILHLSLLSGLVVPMAGLIVPIIIFVVKKESLPGLVPHANVVFNWMISAVIYLMGGLILTVTLIGAIVGIPLMLAVAVVSIVFPIIGGIKASEGEVWPYPLSIPIFK